MSSRRVWSSQRWGVFGEPSAACVSIRLVPTIVNPFKPSVALMTLKPSEMLLYILGLAYISFFHVRYERTEIVGEKVTIRRHR